MPSRNAGRAKLSSTAEDPAATSERIETLKCKIQALCHDSSGLGTQNDTQNDIVRLIVYL